MKLRIQFLKAIVKLFILDYVLNGEKTKSVCISTLDKVEEYIKNIKEIKGMSISMQSTPIRNLLSLTKIQKFLFIIGVGGLYKIECADRNKKLYRIHLIATSKDKAVELFRKEFKNDMLDDVEKIEINNTALFSRDELLELYGKNTESVTQL